MNVTTERALLFQCPDTITGWQDQMILHIAAAKRLGYTNLEIDITTRLAKREAKQPPQGFRLFSFLEAREVEGDEWKKGTAEAEHIVVQETVVKVWATRVSAVTEAKPEEKP